MRAVVGAAFTLPEERLEQVGRVAAETEGRQIQSVVLALLTQVGVVVAVVPRYQLQMLVVLAVPVSSSSRSINKRSHER